MVELFKSSPSGGELACPMCEGKGKLAPTEGKLEVRFGEELNACNEKELALVLAHTAQIWELGTKLGLDPSKINMSFDFKDTGHHLCFMVAKKEAS
jgi:hypothetical protein